MTKLVQAFLSGVFFTFILDFFIILGIKINYLEAHNINVYYNILFADHQNIFIFLFFTIIIGYLVSYASTKSTLIGVGTLFVLAFSTLIPPVGEAVGELILLKKDITLKTDKFSYHGDIYYDGRKEITFYDYKLKKVIILNKNKVIGEY
jgi:hypothetical protein